MKRLLIVLAVVNGIAIGATAWAELEYRAAYKDYEIVDSALTASIELGTGLARKADWEARVARANNTALSRSAELAAALAEVEKLPPSQRPEGLDANVAAVRNEIANELAEALAIVAAEKYAVRANLREALGIAEETAQETERELAESIVYNRTLAQEGAIRVRQKWGEGTNIREKHAELQPHFEDAAQRLAERKLWAISILLISTVCGVLVWVLVWVLSGFAFRQKGPVAVAAEPQGVTGSAGVGSQADKEPPLREEGNVQSPRAPPRRPNLDPRELRLHLHSLLWRRTDRLGSGAAMEFPEAVRTCLKKYVDFQGRAGRAEFWWFFLATVGALLVAAVIDQAFFGGPGLFYGLTILGLALPQLSAQVRRLHDTGRSGWWALIGLVPVAGSILLIVWCCQEGDRDSNAYGEPPASSTAPSSSMGLSDRPSRPRTSNDLARLEQLHALHEKGALTAEEFAAEKAKLLG